MGKKMSKAGAELRRDIRADVDADPTIDHKILRSKYTVGELIVESALTKSVAEWEVVIAGAADEPPAKPVVQAPAKHPSAIDDEFTSTLVPAPAAMPGLEQGFVKFGRKPAKMGEDYIFWVPRVYIKNGLVDPKAEYEVYLKQATRKPTIESGHKKK